MCDRKAFSISYLYLLFPSIISGSIWLTQTRGNMIYYPWVHIPTQVIHCGNVSYIRLRLVKFSGYVYCVWVLKIYLWIGILRNGNRLMWLGIFTIDIWHMTWKSFVNKLKRWLRSWHKTSVILNHESILYIACVSDIKLLITLQGNMTTLPTYLTHNFGSNKVLSSPSTLSYLKIFIN